MQVERPLCSGGVIFRVVNGAFEVGLIFRGKDRCLPKGLIEEGETAEDAAIREVKEETGLEGEIVQKLGAISYSYRRDKRYFKTVHFFLLRHVGGSTHNHDCEADESKWVSISEALHTLTYPLERRILEKAERILIDQETSPPI